MAIRLPELGLGCRNCSDALKIQRGCTKDSPFPDKWPMNTKNPQRCPVKFVNPIAYSYIRAFNRLEKGVLPGSGGYLEQTAKYNHAMDIISKEIAEQTKERTERDKRRTQTHSKIKRPGH
jgi:hypothetical protein